MYRCVVELLRPPLSVSVVASRGRHRPATKAKFAALSKKNYDRKVQMGLIEVKKKLTFAQRMEMIQALKSGNETVADFCLVWPSRTLKTSNTDKPVDDVFRLSAFNNIYSFDESIAMHRELCAPTMFNESDTSVQLRLDLNMNIQVPDEETTVYVDESSKVVLLPHKFDLGVKRTIFAFCRTPEQIEAATNAGAEFIGEADSVRKIIKGHIKVLDVDYFVAHSDMTTDIGPLRGVIRSKFPSTLNHAVGNDITKLVEMFRHGVEMNIKRSEQHPEWGVCQSPIGKLNMPVEQLEENADTFIKNVCKCRPLAASLGHFIYRAVLTVQNQKEYHEIDFTKYAPPVPDDDSGLKDFDSSTAFGGKKKKKKRAMMSF